MSLMSPGMMYVYVENSGLKPTILYSKLKINDTAMFDRYLNDQIYIQSMCKHGRIKLGVYV